MKSIKQFIINLYNNDGSFSFSSNNKVSNLYSTCFGVMCLDLIGELNTFNDKDKIIKFINQYQDEKTGYFIDKTCIPKSHAKHDKDYIFLQLTDFAQLALSALNEKPRIKYHFFNKYKDVKYLTSWFYNLNWKNPWLASNVIMFILNCFIYEDEIKNKCYIDHIIELLNKTQDQNNGYWNLNNKVSLHNQMAGAYHFLFFYTYLEINPSYFEKIIDSTLKIQNFDGLFNYATGGGSCDDLDAVDLLCRGNFYTSYKYQEINKSLLKTHKSLLKNQNSDGGFCWSKGSKNIFNLMPYSLNFKLFKSSKIDFKINFFAKAMQVARLMFNRKKYWRYSGLQNMKLDTSSSDLFSTWFRLTSIAIIEETYPQICNYKKTINWNLRKKCGLGFYKK
jgi:prenyltransferase beta subunit